MFVPCLLVSFNPLISFCFARKRQRNNSKTARFIPHSPGSTLNIFISYVNVVFYHFLCTAKCVLSIKVNKALLYLGVYEWKAA